MESHIIYMIDDKDRLVFVNEQWAPFARDNHAGYLAETAILYRPLWDFVVDRETRQIYQMMFDKVRTLAAPLSFSYRCDTPNKRRLMQMMLLPQENRYISFISQVVHEEARTPMVLIDPLQARSDELLNICGWCKKVQLTDGRWVEVEEAAEKLGLFTMPVLPQLSHGICPACLQLFKSGDAMTSPARA